MRIPTLRSSSPGNVLIGLAAAFLLPGCASSNFKKDFTCGTVEGMPCTSISDIHETIVQPGSLVSPVMGGSKSPPVATFTGAPLWKAGTVMKVHVAGFVDASNNLHEESVLYTVLDHGGWKVAY